MKKSKNFFYASVILLAVFVLILGIDTPSVKAENLSLVELLKTQIASIKDQIAKIQSQLFVFNTLSPVDSANCHTKTIWDWGYCTPDCKCDAGIGDCNSDFDCNTNYCAKDIGTKYGKNQYVDVCENRGSTSSSQPTTQITPPSCTDSDGADIYTKGNVNFGNYLHNDYCANNYIVEYLCTNNLLDLNVVICQGDVSCGYGDCSDSQKPNWYCNSSTGSCDYNCVEDSSCVSVPIKQLIAHYSFEENANDVSGNNNNGTIYGNPVYTNGVSGQALDFDGSDDRIITPIRRKDSVSMTVSAWFVYEGDCASGYSSIIGSNDGRFGIAKDTGKNYLGVQDHYWRHPVSKDICDNFWHHLVFTRDVDNAGKLYIDKELQWTYVFGTAISNSNFNIGEETGYWWNGKIDEVKIWNYALSEQEIKDEYDSVSKFLCDSDNECSYVGEKKCEFAGLGVAMRRIRTCVLKENGCLGWSDAELCTGDTSCGYGDCSDEAKPIWYCDSATNKCAYECKKTPDCGYDCVDECQISKALALAGKPTTKCSSDGKSLLKCSNYDDDTCLEWGLLEECAEEKDISCGYGKCSEIQKPNWYCLNTLGDCTYKCDKDTTCGADCINECPGLHVKQCLDDTHLQICGNFDSDDCLEWRQFAHCDYGQICSSQYHQCVFRADPYFYSPSSADLQPGSNDNIVVKAITSSTFITGCELLSIDVKNYGTANFDTTGKNGITGIKIYYDETPDDNLSDDKQIKEGRIIWLNDKEIRFDLPMIKGALSFTAAVDIGRKANSGTVKLGFSQFTFVCSRQDPVTLQPMAPEIKKFPLEGSGNLYNIIPSTQAIPHSSLSVELADNTPVSGTIKNDSVNNIVAKVVLYGDNNRDIFVRRIYINSYGSVFNYNNIKIFDENNSEYSAQIGQNPTGTSYRIYPEVPFSQFYPYLIIPKGGSKTISIAVDVSKHYTEGQTFQFGISEVWYGVNYFGPFLLDSFDNSEKIPIMGNNFEIKTSCVNECSRSKLIQCFNSTQGQICGNYDDDYCLEWSPIFCTGSTSCGYGHCSNNQRPSWYCCPHCEPDFACTYTCIEDQTCTTPIEWQNVSFPYCSDTDNGKDFKNKGTLLYKGTFESKSYTYNDMCLSGDLIEFYCMNGMPRAERNDCICRNGACAF